MRLPHRPASRTCEQRCSGCAAQLQCTHTLLRRPAHTSLVSKRRLGCTSNSSHRRLCPAQPNHQPDLKPRPFTNASAPSHPCASLRHGCAKLTCHPFVCPPLESASASTHRPACRPAPLIPLPLASLLPVFSLSVTPFSTAPPQPPYMCSDPSVAPIRVQCKPAVQTLTSHWRPCPSHTPSLPCACASLPPGAPRSAPRTPNPNPSIHLIVPIAGHLDSSPAAAQCSAAAEYVPFVLPGCRRPSPSACTLRCVMPSACRRRRRRPCSLPRCVFALLCMRLGPVCKQFAKSTQEAAVEG